MVLPVNPRLRRLKQVLEKTGPVRIAARTVQGPTASRGDFNAIFADPAIEPVRTVTGTPMDAPHRKELWLTFGECLANGDKVAVAGIAVRTAFRWRPRFLAGSAPTPKN